MQQNEVLPGNRFRHPGFMSATSRPLFLEEIFSLLWQIVFKEKTQWRHISTCWYFNVTHVTPSEQQQQQQLIKTVQYWWNIFQKQEKVLFFCFLTGIPYLLQSLAFTYSKWKHPLCPRIHCQCVKHTSCQKVHILFVFLGVHWTRPLKGLKPGCKFYTLIDARKN